LGSRVAARGARRCPCPRRRVLSLLHLRARLLAVAALPRRGRGARGRRLRQAAAGARRIRVAPRRPRRRRRRRTRLCRPGLGCDPAARSRGPGRGRQPGGHRLLLGGALDSAGGERHRGSRRRAAGRRAEWARRGGLAPRRRGSGPRLRRRRDLGQRPRPALGLRAVAAQLDALRRRALGGASTRGRHARPPPGGRPRPGSQRRVRRRSRHPHRRCLSALPVDRPFPPAHRWRRRAAGAERRGDVEVRLPQFVRYRLEQLRQSLLRGRVGRRTTSRQEQRQFSPARGAGRDTQPDPPPPLGTPLVGRRGRDHRHTAARHQPRAPGVEPLCVQQHPRRAARRPGAGDLRPRAAHSPGHRLGLFRLRPGTRLPHLPLGKATPVVDRRRRAPPRHRHSRLRTPQRARRRRRRRRLRALPRSADHHHGAQVGDAHAREQSLRRRAPGRRLARRRRRDNSRLRPLSRRRLPHRVLPLLAHARSVLRPRRRRPLLARLLLDAVELARPPLPRRGTVARRHSRHRRDGHVLPALEAAPARPASCRLRRCSAGRRTGACVALARRRRARRFCLSAAAGGVDQRRPVDDARHRVRLPAQGPERRRHDDARPQHRRHAAAGDRRAARCRTQRRAPPRDHRRRRAATAQRTGHGRQQRAAPAQRLGHRRLPDHLRTASARPSGAALLPGRAGEDRRELLRRHRVLVIPHRPDAPRRAPNPAPQCVVRRRCGHLARLFLHRRDRALFAPRRRPLNASRRRCRRRPSRRLARHRLARAHHRRRHRRHRSRRARVDPPRRHELDACPTRIVQRSRHHARSARPLFRRCTRHQRAGADRRHSRCRAHRDGAQLRLADAVGQCPAGPGCRGNVDDGVGGERRPRRRRGQRLAPDLELRGPPLSRRRAGRRGRRWFPAAGRRSDDITTQARRVAPPRHAQRRSRPAADRSPPPAAPADRADADG